MRKKMLGFLLVTLLVFSSFVMVSCESPAGIGDKITKEQLKKPPHESN